MAMFKDDIDKTLAAYELKLMEQDARLPVPATPAGLPAIKPGEYHNPELGELAQQASQVAAEVKAMAAYLKNMRKAINIAGNGVPDFRAFQSYREFGDITRFALQPIPDVIQDNADAVAAMQHMQREAISQMGRIFPMFEKELKRMLKRGTPIQHNVVNDYIMAKGMYNLVTEQGMSTQDAVTIVKEHLKRFAVKMSDHDFAALYEPIKRLNDYGYEPLKHDVREGEEGLQGAKIAEVKNKQSETDQISRRQALLQIGGAAVAAANLGPHAAAVIKDDYGTHEPEEKETETGEPKPTSSVLHASGVLVNCLTALASVLKGDNAIDAYKQMSDKRQEYGKDIESLCAAITTRAWTDVVAEHDKAERQR